MLIVNASKSNAMFVTTRQKETVLTDDINLYFGDERLNVVTSFDYLGLKYDKNIRWDVYIESFCQELSKKIWILSRLREFLPFELLLNIYKSTIQPKIDYGISVWGFTSDMNLNRIQRLQNRAARAMYNNYDYVNTRGLDLLVDMKVMNVRQRRDYFVSLLMFKSIHGLAPDYMVNDIVMAIEVSERQTRNNNVNDLYIPVVNIEISKHALSYQGPKVWNSLPDSVRECTNLETFKCKARGHFLNFLAY